MGLKFLYYIDTSANWTLFTFGIICVPFGIGGMLLTTPIRQKNVYYPWYHATGIWVGMVFLVIAMMMPFARFHPAFLRLAVVVTYLAMIVSSVGLGVGIDEFTNWFENPTVKTFGTDAVLTDSNVYVSQTAKKVVFDFGDFDLFHKVRVIVVMAGTLLGICMLLFRIVTLGLVIFDEFTTSGYDVFTPEEEMMYQAMAERDIGGEDEGEKADYEAGYQPILYAGAKSKIKIPDLPFPKIEEGDEKDYEKAIKDLGELTEAYGDETALIYDPTVYVKKTTEKIEILPEYTDVEGNLLSKKLKLNVTFGEPSISKSKKKDNEGEERILLLPMKHKDPGDQSDHEDMEEPTETTSLLKK